MLAGQILGILKDFNKTTEEKSKFFTTWDHNKTYTIFFEPCRETVPAVLLVEMLSTGTARNSARTVSVSSPEAVNSHTAELVHQIQMALAHRNFGRFTMFVRVCILMIFRKKKTQTHTLSL